MATTTRLTIDEFLDSPLVHEKPYRELINGEPVPKMSPTSDHSDIESNLIMLFAAHQAARGGIGRGEVHVPFRDPADPRTLVPDFVYYRDRRRYTRPYPQTPDLAVEVRSPGQSFRMLREKAQYYLDHGVSAVWIVEPVRQFIEVWDAEHEGIRFGDSDMVTFDDITLDVADIVRIAGEDMPPGEEMS